MTPLDAMRRRATRRDLAAYSLVGAARAIAAREVGLSDEWYAQKLREAVAECDAEMAAADAEYAAFGEEEAA